MSFEDAPNSNSFQDFKQDEMKKAVYWFACITVLFASCKTDTNSSNEKESELRQIQEREQRLLRTNDSLLTIIGQLSGNKGITINPSTRTLKRYGIPESDTGLAGYLQEKHPELLPDNAVLGGANRFYQATPLEGNFVFAYYEDGHNGGYTLLQYKPKANGELNWESVYQTPPEQ